MMSLWELAHRINLELVIVHTLTAPLPLLDGVEIVVAMVVVTLEMGVVMEEQDNMAVAVLVVTVAMEVMVVIMGMDQRVVVAVAVELVGTTLVAVV
jgi:hypothetical protein